MEGGSTLGRGDFEALFSAANCDRGRARGPVDPLEVGRCCHDKVPALEGAIDELGDVVDSVAGLDGGWGRSRGGDGRLFEVASTGTLASSPIVSFNEAWGGWKVIGDIVTSSCLGLSIVDLTEAGVPPLEERSLVGEMDLARSEVQSAKSLTVSTLRQLTGSNSLTSPTRLSLFPALQDFFF